MKSQAIVSGAILLVLGGLAGCSDLPTPANTTLGVSASRVSAAGHTLVVDDDGADCPQADFTSIQAAVNAAQPGSTILVCAGTYREWVLITKDNLRLLAKGQPGDVVLDGQNLPGTTCGPASVTAFRCAGFELRNADGNLIEGFVVKRYWEAGIWLHLGSDGNTIRKNVTTETPHHDGIQLRGSSHNIIEQNTSFANFAPALNACGINVQDATSIGNIVRHNETFTNDFGIQIAANAVDNIVFQNEVHDNRRFGIRNVVGATGTLIDENRSQNNAGPGIALLQSNLVTVARNKAFNNVPDILWDGAGMNEFENDHCRTSVPPGLCEHTEGASAKK